jgi:hypothetical protein
MSQEYFPCNRTLVYTGDDGIPHNLLFEQGMRLNADPKDPDLIDPAVIDSTGTNTPVAFNLPHLFARPAGQGLPGDTVLNFSILIRQGFAVPVGFIESLLDPRAVPQGQAVDLAESADQVADAPEIQS